MKPILEIIRLEESGQGTVGILKINKVVFCSTLEPTDRLNLQDKSSIPAQQYDCKKIKTTKYGETYEIQDVPERSGVLFHAGNIARHTKGCILLGQYPDKLKGERAVLNSGTTFKKFIKLLKDYPIISLTITEDY